MKEYDTSIKEYLQFAKKENITTINWDFIHVMKSQSFLAIKEEYRNKFIQFTNYAQNFHSE